MLEKYWQCETSLEEEEQLRDFFREGSIPPDMNAAADLFRLFAAEKVRGVGGSFELLVTKKLRERRSGKIRSMMSFGNMARIASTGKF